MPREGFYSLRFLGQQQQNDGEDEIRHFSSP